MNLATWKSIKSPIMQEIREQLKRVAPKGSTTLSRKEANRTWREDILGILSEEQKKQVKAQKQEKSQRKKSTRTEGDVD
jgi:hypothetical protein